MYICSNAKHACSCNPALTKNRCAKAPKAIGGSTAMLHAVSLLSYDAFAISGLLHLLLPGPKSA